MFIFLFRDPGCVWIFRRRTHIYYRLMCLPVPFIGLRILNKHIAIAPPNNAPRELLKMSSTSKTPRDQSSWEHSTDRDSSRPASHGLHPRPYHSHPHLYRIQREYPRKRYKVIYRLRSTIHLNNPLRLSEQLVKTISLKHGNHLNKKTFLAGQSSWGEPNGQVCVPCSSPLDRGPIQGVT